MGIKYDNSVYRGLNQLKKCFAWLHTNDKGLQGCLLI